MATTRVWLLNLDANDELAAPANYKASSAVRHALRRHRLTLETLMGPGGVDLARWEGKGAPGAFAFCPTPHARGRFAALGLTPPASPGLEILTRVNRRDFLSELADKVPISGRVVSDVASVRRDAKQWPVRVKHPFGFAGRGHARLGAESMPPDKQRWLEKLLAQFGFVWLEPERKRELDVALHGFLSQTGSLCRGRITTQRVSAAGQWLGSRPLRQGELSPSHAAAFQSAFDDVAERLRQVGYFGPFGIDGFTYWAGREKRLVPLCDINGRYSMGFGVGFAEERPDLHRLEPERESAVRAEAGD